MNTYSRITRDTNTSFIKQSTKISGETMFFKIEKGSPEYSNTCSLFHANNIDILEGNFVDEKFDVYFNDDNYSNNKGFSFSYEACYDYITSNNGSNESYFGSYKNGTVSIVNEKTGVTIFETKIL
ncbi:hypothetical protein SL053_002414 [Flavobacterium psychrophilum]|nr:hypothetical protein [Flavobacterium psychrophilum]